MNNYFDNLASQWDQNPLKVERAQVTAQKIKEIRFKSYRSFVDFGCGTGLLGVQLRDMFEQIHLLDSSTEMLKVAQHKVANAGLSHIQAHHVERLGDLTSPCSAIATLMTLHHVIDIKQFFSDAHQVLEDSGILIIADLLAEDGTFHSHNPAFNGHNGFDITVLSEIASDNGFIVKSAEQYYEIWKENAEGIKVAYPLFLLIAQKN